MEIKDSQYGDFLAEFARPEEGGPPDHDKGKDDLELSEKELAASKMQAQKLLDSISALETAFPDRSKMKLPELMLSIKVDNDGQGFDVSTISGHGEADYDAIEKLQQLLNDCSKVKILGHKRFVDLFVGSNIYQTSPKKLFELLKDALASAEEVG